MKRNRMLVVALMAIFVCCIAVGMFSVFAAEPEVKIYSKYNYAENTDYQNRSSADPRLTNSVSVGENGISMSTTAPAGYVGEGAAVGLLVEKADSYEVTVAPGTMSATGSGAYTRLEFIFSSRVEGNSLAPSGFTMAQPLIYMQLNPISGDYSNGVDALVIVHPADTAVWGQVQTSFPSGVNGDIKIEIKQSGDRFVLAINGQEFDDGTLGAAITVNDIVSTLDAANAGKPFMSLSHSFPGAASAESVLTSTIKSANGAYIKGNTDVIGGDIVGTENFDMADWTDASYRSADDANHPRLSLTENGISMRADFVNGPVTNGYPMLYYKESMPADQDEYSVTFTDIQTSEVSRVSLWWANIMGAWNLADSSIYIRLFPNDNGGQAHFYITNESYTDVANGTILNYPPVADGSVTVALRKSADGYVIVVNGAVANIGAAGIAGAISNMSEKGGIYFASCHDFDGNTSAGLFGHTIKQLNGIRFVPADITEATGENIEYKSADWSFGLSSSENEYTASYSEGLKVETTIKAGVSGQWSTLIYKNPFSNNLPEYSMQLSLENVFYQNGLNFGKYIMYLADQTENVYNTGKYIMISIEPAYGELSEGGSARVIMHTDEYDYDSGYVPYMADGNNITLVVRADGQENYDMYVNGSKISFNSESAVSDVLSAMQQVYFAMQIEYAGTAENDIATASVLKAVNGGTIINAVPDAVTMQAAPVAGNVGKTSVTLSWESFSNTLLNDFDRSFTVNKYQIKRIVGETVAEEFIVNDLSELTFTDTGLSAGTQYTYSIEALDAENNLLAVYPNCVVATEAEVDLSDLEEAIDAAESSLSDVTISSDGSELAAGEKYYNQADVDTYQSAIDAAKAVAEKSGVTQAEADAAVAALSEATAAFQAAEKTAEGDLSDLEEAIGAAESSLSDVTISSDGSELAAGEKYYNQADVDTYQSAMGGSRCGGRGIERSDGGFPSCGKDGRESG